MKNLCGEYFFFHKDINSCVRKKFLSWKTTLKKERNQEILYRDNSLWQKEKPFFIWIREIKKDSKCTEMNQSNQSKKTG